MRRRSSRTTWEEMVVVEDRDEHQGSRGREVVQKWGHGIENGALKAGWQGEGSQDRASAEGP